MKLINLLQKFYRTVFGRKVDGTRVIPITSKIIVIFTMFILFSNITTNYINLVSNQKEIVKMIKEMLVKDLKDLYTFCNNQYGIYQFNQDLKGSVNRIQDKAVHEFKKQKSIALGIKTNANFLFQASKIKKFKYFQDSENMKRMIDNRKKNINEGFLTLKFNDEEYFAVYKYSSKWKAYILRGEELNEFYGRSQEIFRNIALISILITIACALIGIFLLKYILRFLHIITQGIMKMTRSQNLELINMKGASNDDITFLGVAFNSLSSTINNMLQIFKKFVNKDVATKAYKEREVRLEGTQKELTCLFSDIKGFTYMTETLGTDIITLINLHYDRAILEILKHDGVIGSIIGDALLAVYGALDETSENKSYQAIRSAYKIQEVALSLRKQMTETKNKIEKKLGKFSKAEEKVFQAVLIEVGVGLDGGNVFYGNIGSNDRMTNTVIGDNVNSASRLEGLTRIYKVPVICSEFVKNDVEENLYNHGLLFLEIDTVQVKGKTIGKKIFWPIPKKGVKRKLKQDIQYFSKGLELYYAGDWSKAIPEFKRSKLAASQIFISRISGKKCPKDWNGIWTMKTK